MYILVYVAPDGQLNATIARTHRRVMQWASNNLKPDAKWRVYDAGPGGGWEAESHAEVWRDIDRVPSMALVVL